MLIFPMHNDTSRKIIHVDMDAFFASVEMRDNPSLKNKPVIIAKHPKETGGRGVVSTANYEARKFGIHSAMSSAEAYKLCPQAVFIPGDYHKYSKISNEISEIFHRYTDEIEPLSIDEAFLDVTHNKINSTSAVKIAKMIQHDIWNELQLTCSAGVSYNKFLAKLGSDFKKPQGLTIILPEDAIDFLKKLPIEEFHGVGKKSVPRFHELGIKTGADLYELSEMDLIAHFGKMGYSLYRKVRGIYNSPVKVSRVRKSIGKERTYGKAIVTEEEALLELERLSKMVSEILLAKSRYGQTVVLKVRTVDFETKTRRITTDFKIYQKKDIFYFAEQLFQEVDVLSSGIRLLGVTVVNLYSLETEQLELEFNLSNELLIH